VARRPVNSASRNAGQYVPNRRRMQAASVPECRTAGGILDGWPGRWTIAACRCRTRCNVDAGSASRHHGPGPETRNALAGASCWYRCTITVP